MRPILAVVLLSSVAAVGSVLRAQEARGDAGQSAARRVTANASSATPAAPTRAATPVMSPAAGFETIVKPFLAENCYGCHGNKKHKKDLNFEEIESVATLTTDGDRWDDVVQKLRHRDMPPDDEPQPPEQQRQAVATWIARELARIDKATPPDPGRITARRLNRNEYNNTIRDLLGVDVRPADDFPQDDSGYGFDNIADVLSLSPVLMEKYVSSGERVARMALFGAPVLKPTLTRLRSEGRRVREVQTVPETYDVTGLSLPNAFHAIHRIPVEGEYVIRVALGGLRPAGSNPVTVALWIDEQQGSTVVHDPERAATFADDRQDFGGQTIEFKVKLMAGDHWISVAVPRIFEGLPARYAGPNPSTRPEPPAREFRPRPGATPEQLAQQRKQFEATQAELARLPLNGVRVNSVDVGGPFAQPSGASRASLEKVYTCGHLDGGHTRMCATRIMTDLARRAFRRPVAAAEVQKYVSLVRLAEEQEHSLAEGLAVGIQALLVSPDFLFRIEQDRAATNGKSSQPIDQHELATRLSYFLWASMPDAALRRAADTGTLRNPGVLAAQVRRMLRDPRARSLAENFGGQWLQFRALESTTRDRERFPDFEDYLRLSMRRETELFVDHVVRDDRSVLDFIDGRYSYINERLARHYGILDVTGPEFRRVDLSATPRTGVLTQGSVLTVSSYATRTSPVMRGKWVLDNLLNAPPPPPPADVPNLDEASIGTSASMREQLEMHRKDAICASCHRRMDPLGFGLENFDAVGAWRSMDGKFPIDATGSLPDGDDFTGPVELAAILKAEREPFARSITSKLMTYALGRGLERYDTKTVKLIASRLPARDYKFSALILEIVNSLPFQSRRAVHTGAPTP
jgi:mono/diheme cytochrome c family protein